jgi:DUF305 family protein family protein
MLMPKKNHAASHDSRNPRKGIDMKTGRFGLGGLAALLLLAPAPAGRTSDTADNFRRMMTEAAARMHVAMHLPFTGDADRDFARMMIPHHQGAIDMALVELRYGKDERLKRLAQEIIVAQQQEIAVMHLALGDALPPGSPAPTHNPHTHREH